MAKTAPMTVGLSDSLSKDMNTKHFFGALTLEEKIQALLPVAWWDNVFAQSKIAVDLPNTNEYMWQDSVVPQEVIRNGFSVSFVAKDWGANTVIFELKATGSNRIFLQLNGSNQFLPYCDMGGSTNNTACTASLTTTGWNFYLITFDASDDSITVYQNGSDVTSVSSLNVDLTDFTGDADFTVGARSAGATPDSQHFTGEIDQLTFHTKVLGQPDATALYNSNDGLNFKDLEVTDNYYPSGSQERWYDFNTIQNFGRNSAEASHAVDITGTSEFTSTSPELTFGADSTVPNEPSISAVTWVNFNAFSGTSTVLGNDGQFIFYLDATGKILVLFEDGGALFTDYIAVRTQGTVNAGEWLHLGFSYDGTQSTGGIKIYINGVSVATDPLTLGSYTAMHAGTNFRIGYTSGAGFIDAKVDEVAVYQDELTSGEVSTLYNGGVVAPARTLHTDNLVSDWSFNEQDPAFIGKDSHGSNDLTPTSIVEGDLVGGKDSLDLTEVSITSANAVAGHISGKAGDWEGVNNWADRSGNGYDGAQATLANTPVYDIISDSVSFDGTDSYLEVASSQGYFNCLHDGTGGTICVMYKANALGISQDFVSNSSSNSQTGVRIRVNAADKSRFDVFNSGGVNFVNNLNVSNASDHDGVTWIKLFCDFDGTTANIYASGLSNSLVASGSPDTGNATNTFKVGSSTLGTNVLDGEIKSCLVIPKVLTASERNVISDYWDTL